MMMNVQIDYPNWQNDVRILKYCLHYLLLLPRHYYCKNDDVRMTVWQKLIFVAVDGVDDLLWK
jgi:hypothetical protein